MEPAADLGKRLVDALHTVHGEHQGHRAAHAKGSCVNGLFTAGAAARELTLAPHMQGAPVPVMLRLSNGSGIPAYPDYARSDGRGFAVKFDLADGRHADMVGLTLPLFFVRTTEDFLEFLAATRPDPETRQPDLARVGAFLERHPETQAALGAAMSPELPASYLTVAYNGIHAFRLTNAAGEARWVRYRWEPELGEASVTPEEARAGGREYLQDDLRRRLAAGPARFRLVFILAGEGDSLTDPTSPWPGGRERVEAGTLEITAMAEPGTCDAMVFDPTNVVEGIECSEDPILHARSVAYARSFALRRGITSPVAPAASWPPDARARAVEAAAGLAPGAMTAVDIDGARLAVVRVDGAVHVFQDACTHRGCSLADGTLSDLQVTCPCHGSVFDIATGEVLRGPAKEPIKTFA